MYQIQQIAAIVFVIILISINTAYPQTVPYIEDITGEEDLEKSEVGEEGLRLIGVFKLFNPDTVPFYLWVIFENGGKFKHTKYADVQSVRLVDLELRYKDDRQRPTVKKFPSDNYEPRVKKRFGGAWLGGGRSGKRNSRGGGADEAEVDVDVSAERGYRGGRGGRGRSVYELVFWKEDAQAYYEMELWGVLYAPDVKEAVAAGNYVENISFEIELAR